MLPGNLLVARKKKGNITPVYADLSTENLKIAEKLIESYQNNIGIKKAVLRDIITELEDSGHDYRYIRGLSTLLDRRCIFHSRVAFDPVNIRHRIFELTGKKGFENNERERRRILEKVAEEFNQPTEEVDSSLYADLEDEFVLKQFNPLHSENLLKWYNLALTQTLLFYSTEAQFTTSSNWQRIFRDIKRLGLIYEIMREEENYWLKVDGPLSLFKLNRRYGTALAKLLPTVIEGKEWTINAKILRVESGWEKRLLILRLESKKYERYLEDEPKSPSNFEIYDSNIEKSFAVRFKSLNTGWILRREPEPIPVDNTVLIPDFSFERGKTTIYMEVIGFWTEDYLRRKVEKLEKLRELDIIIAVDVKLLCHKVEKLRRKMKIIYFKGTIPVKPFLSYLRSIEEKIKKKEVDNISTETILSTIKEPAIDVKTLADKLNIMEKTAYEIIKEKSIPGYITLPGMLIKEEKMGEIESRLDEEMRHRQLSLAEASALIENLGGINSTLILENLGYKVKWWGIDLKNTKIERKN